MVWQWQRHMGYLNFEKSRSHCSEIRHYMCVRYQNRHPISLCHTGDALVWLVWCRHMGHLTFVGIVAQIRHDWWGLIGRIAQCLARIWHCILCAFATLSFFFFFFLTFSLNTHTYGVGSIMYTHTNTHTPVFLNNNDIHLRTHTRDTGQTHRTHTRTHTHAPVFLDDRHISVRDTEQTHTYTHTHAPVFSW